MQLLFFFKISIKLGNTFEGKFFGKADVTRLWKILISELLNLSGVSGTKQ